MTTKINSNISIIGWYQIIGGGIGILMILYSLTGAQLSGLNGILYACMFLFFAYSVFCGILCLKHKDNALKLSLINQFLQLIGFSAFGFSFAYAAGIYLSLGVDLSTSFDVKFNVGISMFYININREHQLAEVNLDIVALVFIYWIDKLSNKVKIEKADIEIASIGQN